MLKNYLEEVLYMDAFILNCISLVTGCLPQINRFKLKNKSYNKNQLQIKFFCIFNSIEIVG